MPQKKIGKGSRSKATPQESKVPDAATVVLEKRSEEPLIPPEPREKGVHKAVQPRRSKTTSTRDDPFLADNVFPSIIGVGGGRYDREYREFTNHYGGYMNLLDCAYLESIKSNQQLATNLPKIWFFYHHVMLLWWRLLAIDAMNGRLPTRFRSILRSLRGASGIVGEACVVRYLQGLGNITTTDGMPWRLIGFPDYGKLSTIKLDGLFGHVGELTDWHTSRLYLQYPMPWMIVQWVKQSLSANPGNRVDMNLSALGLNLRPTREVLGYMELSPQAPIGLSIARDWGWINGTPAKVNDSLMCLDVTLLQCISDRLRGRSVGQVLDCHHNWLMDPRGSKSQLIFSAFERAGSEKRMERVSETESCTPHCSEQVSSHNWFVGTALCYKFEVPSQAARATGWYHKPDNGTDRPLFPNANPNDWAIEDTRRMLHSRFHLRQMRMSDVLARYRSVQPA